MQRVGEDGMVHVVVPDAEPGTEVVVIITKTPMRRLEGFGRLRGKLIIRDDFDDPIPGMEEYM
jgi:hypothetical protein